MRNILTIFSFFFAFSAMAQFSPQYNSYMLNSLIINPAYTGTRECLSVIGLHSSQWIGFEGAPMSDFLTVHSPINEKHALGVMVNNDKIGVQNRTGIYPSYAYHLKLSDKQKLSFGVNAGVNFFSSKNTDVKTQQSDVTFQQNVRTRSLPNIGAGLYYYTKKWFAGISAPSLFSSEYTNVAGQNNAFEMKSKSLVLLLSAGGVVNLTEDFVWKPSLLYKTILAGVYQMDLNSNFYFKDKISAGISYRHKDAFVGMIGFRLNTQFDLAYSYAYPLSNIVRVSSGSHEIMLRFELRKKVDTFNPRYF